MLPDFHEFEATSRDFKQRCSLETAQATKIRIALDKDAVFNNGQQSLREEQQQHYALALLFWLRNSEPVYGDGLPSIIRSNLRNNGYIVVGEDNVLTATTKLHDIPHMTNQQIITN